MPLDPYRRNIDYLRLSVTDRCNLRCIYCMPQGTIVPKASSEILSFEEIIRIVKLCVNIGISKIKVSGGEPLVRNGLPRLLKSLVNLAGIRDLSITTNGTLLKKYIKELRKSGLQRLNVSIDTLDAEKFRRITGTGELTDVLEGIEAAIEEGFFLKLNVVMMRGVNDDEILKFAKFAKERQLIIRFIELMPMTDNRSLSEDLYISCEEIKNELKVLGNLWPVCSESFGNGPAQYYRIEKGALTVGFISPISCKFCLNCNRLRLTSTGMLMPCLTSEEGFDLRGPLRQNTDEEVVALINKATLAKPVGHDFDFTFPRQYLMSQIGG